jgi:hypothetical protein
MAIEIQSRSYQSEHFEKARAGYHALDRWAVFAGWRQGLKHMIIVSWPELRTADFNHEQTCNRLRQYIVSHFRFLLCRLSGPTYTKLTGYENVRCAV